MAGRLVDMWSVQLVEDNGTPFSAPVTIGEAGVYLDNDNRQVVLPGDPRRGSRAPRHRRSQAGGALVARDGRTPAVIEWITCRCSVPADVTAPVGVEDMHTKMTTAPSSTTGRPVPAARPEDAKAADGPAERPAGARSGGGPTACPVCGRGAHELTRALAVTESHRVEIENPTRLWACKELGTITEPLGSPYEWLTCPAGHTWELPATVDIEWAA